MRRSFHKDVYCYVLSSEPYSNEHPSGKHSLKICFVIRDPIQVSTIYRLWPSYIVEVVFNSCLDVAFLRRNEIKVCSWGKHP